MWPEKEVSEVFVQSLVALLWYIDNHHSTFNERSHKIPPIFDRFTGYNMPQVHKHRKCSAENLSSILLTDYSNKLFRCLQSCYWERSIWRNFKTDVEMLAKSMHDYASYLRDQSNVKLIDSEVCVDEVTKKCVKNYENLQKKCGVDGCNICKPIRLPCEVFDKISFLPDPVATTK